MWGEPRRRTRNITIAALLVASLTLSFTDLPFVRFLSTSAATSARPLERPAWKLSRCAGLLPTLLRRHDDLQEENRELRQRLAELENRLVVLADQLAQSERELAVAAELPGGLDATKPRALLARLVGLPVEVVGLSADSWRQICRVNRGSASGAAKGQPVLWGAALVGLVEAVGPVGAEVRLTTDPESRVWCADARSGAEAVVLGSGRDALRLAHVSWPADIVPGDVFLTTGKAGRYPGGLVVGVVQEVRSSADSVAAVVVLQPRVTIRELRSLFLLPWSPATVPPR